MQSRAGLHQLKHATRARLMKKGIIMMMIGGQLVRAEPSGSMMIPTCIIITVG